MWVFLYFRCRTFRQALDAEIRESNKLGIAQDCKMEKREEMTDEEEVKLWQLQLLGSYSVEFLLHTLYFYNGKMFGRRANKHRLSRVCNIKVVDNYIIFYESTSKTFHGGLKALKREPRYVKHECHRVSEIYSPCL